MWSGQFASRYQQQQQTQRKGRTKARLAVLSAAVAVVAAQQSSFAASGVWNGSTSNVWSDPANWDGGVIPGATSGTTSTDIVSFVVTPTTTTMDVDAGRNVAGFTFDTSVPTTGITVGSAGTNGGPALTFSGGGSTVLEGANPVAVQNYDFNAPMILGGASYTFTNNSGNTADNPSNGALRINGNVAPGAAGLTTLYLDGDHGNTSSSRAEFFGTLSDGAGTLSVVKNGAGTWEMNQGGVAPNTYSGDTVINAGIIRNGVAGTFNGFGGFSLNSHYIVNNGGTLRNTVVGASIGRVTVNFGGLITVSSAASTTLNFQVNSGAALELDYDTPTNTSEIALSLPVSLTGTVAEQGGITMTAATGVSGTGRVSLGATGSTLNLGTVTRVFDIGKGGEFDALNPTSLRIRGPIVGTAGWIKKGAGIVQLESTGSTFSGTLEVREGGVRGSNNGSISNQFSVGLPSLLVSGGTFHIYGGQTQTFGPVTITKGSITASNTLSTLRAPSYTINVGTGDTATVETIIADATGASPVVKNGAGSATFSGALTYTGSTTVNAGILSIASSLTTSPSISITGGELEVRTTLDPNRVVKTPTLSVTGSGKLDLKHNRLITATAVGTHNGTNYTGVTGMVEAGRNGGFWDGPGVTTSMPDATSGSNYTGLAVASASEVFGIGPSGTATWAGETVTGSNALVMYTYGGDANLSGFVDIDDYGQIDFNASTGGALTGYFNGDFDYNGIQDIDDYGIIDFVVNIQGPPFPSTGISIAAVPEPTAACGLALLTGALLRRKRR